AGGLSLFYIGQQFFSTINQILYKAVASPLTPGLALDAKEGDWEKYRRAYYQRLLMILALTVSGSLLLLLIGLPLLHLAIGHGGVTSENVRTLWLIMLSLGGVLVGGAALQVTSVGFYALGDTRTPTLLSVAIFTLCIPFKVLVFRRYGLTGLGVTMSIYFVTCFLIQFIVLEKAFRRRLGQVPQALAEEQVPASGF
ncbi:MAG TPA: lipid II flippase MurJ, partial [Pyrinomonadaceae bacterium]|nr:lipid II flippase MurJ [Pyrinomonadaceae bacterium]